MSDLDLLEDKKCVSVCSVDSHQTTYKEPNIMKITKLFFALVAGTLLAVAPRVLADAATGQAVTITGNMVCGKCTLHLTKSCQNVVQVTQDGKTVNYFLVHNDLSKDNHDPICGGGS